MSAGGSVRLELDHSCRTGLTWRCDVRPGALSSALIDAFEERGWTLARESFGLAVFEEQGSRHRVLLVVATGRLQVRLDYVTPPERRADEANRVGAALGRILEDGGALPP